MAKPEAPPWRNRIVGEGEVDPEQLLANPLNWRIHPRNQQAALQGVLDKVGWVQKVTINQRTGFVVDGHLRIAMALRKHEATVPAQFVDLDEDEERLVLATLDPIAAMASTDRDQIKTLLDSIPRDSDDIALTLAQIAVQEGVFINDVMSDVPDMPVGGEDLTEVKIYVTMPDRVAPEVLAILDGLKRRGVRWQRRELSSSTSTPSPGTEQD